MKSNIKPVIFLFIFLTVAAVALTACNLSPDAADLAAECVRIHIRANSNSECDQQVKLKVRDDVTAYLTKRLEGCRDKSDAVRILTDETDELTAIADNTLTQNGYSYKSRAALKNEYFPDRDYDGYDFPAGNYDALIIELGSGEGQNWWCVAFPPLCFVPDGGSGEKVVYKSWIKEKLDELFGNRSKII